MARDYTPDAIKALVIGLHHPASRVPAAVALLDRGWGKPTQTIETTSESTVLHLIAAQEISAALLQSQQQPPVIEHASEHTSDDTPKE